MSQTLECQFVKEGQFIDYTPVAAVTGGQMVQLPDGRAAFAPQDIAAGVLGSVQVYGIVRLKKSTATAFLKGGDVFWDISANNANYAPGAATGDFKCGVAHSDQLAADTEVDVVLNGRTHYTIDLERRDAGQDADGWTTEATLGLGITADTLGQIFTASFDAVAEAAQAALFSKRTVPINMKPIFEGRVAVYGIGDNAALDINLGLASGSHATDFEAVAAFATVQLDGASLNINTHSDDGTTDRAPADSTIDAVDDTFFEVWIDARDDANVKYYIDGVLVDTSATKRVLTAALTTAVAAMLHVEKTSDDTVADVRVTRMRVRTQTE